MKVLTRLCKSLLIISMGCFFANAAFSATTSATLSTEPNLPLDGWQQLFNGKDLTGWQHVGKGKFIIDHGYLRSDGNMGVLWYNKQTFGDCVIRVVYKVNDPSANSGVFVRIAHAPKDQWDVVNNGYEVQIKDTEDAYHRTGAIYSMGKAAPAPTNPAGEWNTMEIFLSGESIIVYVNGSMVTQFTSGQAVPPQKVSTEPNRSNTRPAYGYIGLQNEDDKLKSGKITHVWFKSVSILPLSNSTS
ncbi:MAG: hypothetical protein K0R66_1304 [Gammaproteobacteria bacterium]|nr:hypothetical protein [Gammaproteobacteria bacterium]